MPFVRQLLDPITTIHGVGPSLQAKLFRLGILSIGDLLCYYPRDYEDHSLLIPFSEFAHNNIYTIATVLAHDYIGYGRMRTLRIVVRDSSGTASLICFNRPFLAQQLPVGSQIALSGKFQYKYNELQSSSFDFEIITAGSEVRRGLIPIYGLTEGLAQNTVRKLLHRVVTEFAHCVDDELPTEIITQRKLMCKKDALQVIHAPNSVATLNEARRTLIYEEFFYFQLMIARRAFERKNITVERKPGKGFLVHQLLARLPFKLTEDQKKVVDEIIADVQKPHPMGRLLQGDVGSGKTLVSFLVALHVIEAGGQVALMAPTELLARQHANSAAKLLEPMGIRLAFLSGNVEDAARPPLLNALKNGGIDFIIGTQALFSDDVVYKNLRLVIVDEQHRFGVLQRIALGGKGNSPDQLMMSATPIPRTLALTVFGDLQVSTIRTMPLGRKPIKTHLTKEGNEKKVYEAVRKLLQAGQQAYFVYPLIDASEKLELKNAIAEYEKIKTKIFPEFKIALIHSKIKEEEKRAVMAQFSRGEVQVLVATSVVEVGVDVPNATAIVIEHAERFGLASLHQLRGRVGRGDLQSYCYLIYSKSLTEDGKERLKAILNTTDGFLLAEEDLRIRGPGELVGTAQSGNLKLNLADPLRDREILEIARIDAFDCVSRDPGLLEEGHAVIRTVLAVASPTAPTKG